jgi:hypothetical protein
MTDNKLFSNLFEELDKSIKICEQQHLDSTELILFQSRLKKLFKSIYKTEYSNKKHEEIGNLICNGIAYVNRCIDKKHPIDGYFMRGFFDNIKLIFES